MSIVTGEAVVLDLRPARVPTRMVATLIDLAVIALLSVAWSELLDTGVIQGSTALGQGLSGLGIILFTLVLPITVETLTRGRGLGAVALGLRVVRDDGGTISFRHSLIRWLCYWFVDFSPFTGFCGGWLCATVNRDGKRIGDLLAGTVVIRVRAPRAMNPPPPVPLELDEWARQLDFTGVGEEHLAIARNLVQRPGRMRDSPRRQLVDETARNLAARLFPRPPAGLPPEDYLAAVVAERRLRAEFHQAQVTSVPTAEQLPTGWR